MTRAAGNVPRDSPVYTRMPEPAPARHPEPDRPARDRPLTLIAWLDTFRADAVFGWRQLAKHKVASAAAILSLALAIGACTSAFRLIDALLLRPLPITAPERLYSVVHHSSRDTGEPDTFDESEYPLFERMRAAAAGRAELIAISPAERINVTYGADHQMERAARQYVSGWMFSSFGLQPALGRLFTEQDDRTPGAHPLVVLSYDYWTRRFNHDPRTIGHTLRIDGRLYEIVGIAEPAFTGTDTGTVTDLFVPAMMHPGVRRDDWGWQRTFVHLRPGTPIAPLRDALHAVQRAFLADRARGYPDMSAAARDRFLSHTLSLAPAGAGVSTLQRDNRRGLTALAVLVALVLLIACANVANLMTAQASARAREMALRVSLGAGRRRLVQLVLVESAWLATLATVVGALFAWWAAPFVVRLINPPDSPVRVAMPADWRVLGFGLVLALGVTALFGLAPALRASSVKPIFALRGGDDAHAWRRVMHGLIGAQVAFCVLVLFVSGLFVATFDRLSHQPTGFSADRLLALDVVASPAQPQVFWDQVADRLRAVPGVDTVALAGWALMSGHNWNGPVLVDGVRRSEINAVFLGVSPGWTDTMKIPFVAGRDFRAGETQPGVAIVNERFVERFFGGANPIGRTFEKAEGDGRRARFQVVGVVRDARYRSLREPAPATAYVPFAAASAGGTASKSRGTFIVRTSIGDPLRLAPSLRRDVPRTRPGFQVADVHTQRAINESHTVRERLLATLASFFAGVALLLAGVGLYGVLDYSVLQRQRELGIRLAIGARGGDIARSVTATSFSMVAAGTIAGMALGIAPVRRIEALFYDVRPTDPTMLALPCLALLAVALAAALPPVIRALRIDPVAMLRGQ